MTEIRPAQIEDCVAITEIWNHVIRDTVYTFNSRQKTLQDLRDLHHQCALAYKPILVAEAEGHVCGFATFGQFRGGVGYAHAAEHTIYLTDAAQGKGIGRRLLSATEDQAKAVGMHSMLAGISGENPAAVAFHRQCGYAQRAVLPQVGRKFDRWFDLVLMQKIL